MTTINHECYVSLEVAKLLKEAGFDWGCHSFYGLDVRHNGECISFDEECELKAEGKESEIEYVDGGTIYSFYHSNKEDENYGGYSRPTLEVAQRWLREVKDIDVYIFPTTNNKRGCVYEWGIKTFGRALWVEGQPYTNQYETYEESQEEGIKKALELILEKGE